MHVLRYAAMNIRYCAFVLKQINILLVLLSFPKYSNI